MPCFPNISYLQITLGNLPSPHTIIYFVFLFFIDLASFLKNLNEYVLKGNIMSSEWEKSVSLAINRSW